MRDKLKIGLYGINGHQIHRRLMDHPHGRLVAVAGMRNPEKIPGVMESNARIYDTLEELLRDPEVELVSLCSPRRADQGKDAIACLRAGKHVYAEKPGALSEAELDEILSVAAERGMEFHEMTDTIYREPYWTMRSLVRSGKLGKVVQVYVQKSYPLRPWLRPQDEETDGGLIRWVGIHAIRFLEHITGERVKDVKMFQTHLGNKTEDSGLFTASSWAMTLENGGVASMCANYLNPKSFPTWGNEAVRVFGTEGMIEITDGATHSHWYDGMVDRGPIDFSESDCRDYLDLYLEHLRFGTPMPMTLEEELHPLRVVIRAFEAAE